MFKDVDTKVYMDGETLVIKHTQDIEDIKAEVALLRGDNNGWSTSGDMKAMYFIPNIVVTHFLNMGLNYYEAEGKKEILRLLKTSEYSYLKI